MHFPFDEEIILQNNIALLRPIEIADVRHLLRVATEDPLLLQFSPARIHTEPLLKAYIETAIENRKQKSKYSFVVFDKRKQMYAGSTSFLNISDPDGRLEIGSTWYGKAFQRTGLNRNCKFLLLQYAFEKLGAQRVELKTDERNIASRRAIEKIGGKFEGILRSHTLLPDGFRRNSVYYSILKEEWPDLRPQFLQATHEGSVQ